MSFFDFEKLKKISLAAGCIGMFDLSNIYDEMVKSLLLMIYSSSHERFTITP